jgi:hypothetical protein
MWAQRKYIDDQVRETRGIDRQKKNGTKEEIRKFMEFSPTAWPATSR